MKTLIINGVGGAGKDTFVDIFSEYAGAQLVQNISTVDKVKEIAKQLGWKGTKDPQDRKYLSDIKDIFTYWCNGPFEDVVKKVRVQQEEWDYYGVEGYSFIHCREPKEIEKLVKELNAETILIVRDTNTQYINHADNEIYQYDNYNYKIFNNGGIEDFRETIKQFYEIIKY